MTVASRDADGGRAQKSKREGAYFFLVAFFFVAFFTVFFGAVFTAFFFAAFAAIVTLASLSPFEMLANAPITTEAHHDDAHRPFYYDESRNGPNRRRYTPAPTLAAGARVTPSHRVTVDTRQAGRCNAAPEAAAPDAAAPAAAAPYAAARATRISPRADRRTRPPLSRVKDGPGHSSMARRRLPSVQPRPA